MKAARTFTYGPEDGEGEQDRIRFKTGEEVPDEVVEALPKDVQEGVILEIAAKKDPNKLSREQLLIMAGINGADEPPPDEEEMSEEDLREAMGEFNTKADLVGWAKEVMDLDLDVDDTRDQLEDQIIEFYFGEIEEDEEDEED